jgi:hypothetical protein
VDLKKEYDWPKLHVKQRDMKISGLEEEAQKKAKTGRKDEKTIMDLEVQLEISKEKEALYTKKIAELEAKVKEQEAKKTDMATLQATVEDVDEE